MIKHQPYKLLNASECSALVQHLQAECEKWAADWFSDEGVVGVECVPASEANCGDFSGQALHMGRCGEPGHWIAARGSSTLVQELGCRLIPGETAVRGHKSSALLSTVVSEAVADLLQRLVPGVGQALNAPQAGKLAEDPASWRKWSGAAVAMIAFGESSLRLQFSPQWVDSRIGKPVAPMKRTPLANQREALGGLRLGLEVRVGETELELALLQTIGVGDVIQLNTRIDEPLQVQTREGEAVCKAYLGCRNGRKSVQLIR